jgi:hypothetical protein
MNHDSLIIEGIVSTRNASGNPHFAAMGPRMPRGHVAQFELRPFSTALTLANLTSHRYGVFHITDRVLQLAQIVTRQPIDSTQWRDLDGRLAILNDVCRWHAFEVESVELSEPRARIVCRVTQSHTEREWVGYNRAAHAVVEMAILATRVGILDEQELRSGLDQVRPWIDKTGGESERAAMALLETYIDSQSRLND